MPLSGIADDGGTMIKTWFLTLFVVATLSIQAFAADTVTSKISHITLFSNQALVTRQAKVDVLQGVNELNIPIEAFRIDSDSVTARVYGEGEILSVQYKEKTIAEAPQDIIKNLSSKIKTLQNNRQVLIDRKRILQNKATFLGAFLDFSQSQIPKEVQTHFPTVEDLEKTLAFLDSSFGDIYSGLHSLDIEIKELDAEIKELEEELAARRGGTKNNLKIIEIQFNAKKPTSVKIETQYLVRGAGWSPLYKVAVSSELDAIDITMFANIKQKSGEHWHSAKLSVSNVIPLRGARLPTLSSWVLDIPRPLARVKGRAAAAAKKSTPGVMMADEAIEADKEAEPATFADADVRQFPLSFEYALQQTVDIESRDKETILPLFTKTLKGEILHYTVPRKSLRTYLVARVSADSELLPGPLNVYLGGRYVGKTHLVEKRAGENFDLALGADRQVTVKREKISDKVKETTFFGKVEKDTVLRELSYKLTIENLKKKPVEVQLMDNIPVSRTDRIKVNNLVISPEPTVENYNNRIGVMIWNLKLAPSAKQEINIDFVVNYPKEVLLPDF
jgi:uncharacterized protein (TIGR02231 family)